MSNSQEIDRRPSIIFCHDDALPLFSGDRGNRFGGAEIQIFELAQELSQRTDLKVLFIVDNADIPLPSYPNIEFIRYPQHIKHGIPGLSRIINQKRTENVIPNPEKTVWIHTLASHATYANFVRARGIGVKYAIRISSDADIDARLIDKSIRDCYISALTSADCVITQTNEQRQNLVDAGTGANAIVISKGISTKPIENRPDSSRSGLVWIGRVVDIKRPWLLVEFARRLPHIQFAMIIGTDDSDLESHVFQNIEHIPNIKIYRDASSSEIHQTLCQSKGLVHTASYEGGAPVVFLEAMRAGCPVYSLSINPDGIFDNNDIGEFFDSDVESMIQWLSSEKIEKEFSRYSSGARTYFELHASIERAADAYVQMVNNIVGES